MRDLHRATEVDLRDLKSLLSRDASDLWTELAALTERATEFQDLVRLSSLRRKAVSRGLARPGAASPPLRLAILGGCSLYPLHELVVHLLETAGVCVELHLGEYDNHVAEIHEPDGALYRFRPDVILLLPGAQCCRYPGGFGDPREVVEPAAREVAGRLLDLCRVAHERTSAEVILGNFALPARHDLGELRARTPASDWVFRKWVNLELGLGAPACVRVCDVEFLASRLGGLAAEDARGWLESRQPGSPPLLVAIAREAAKLVLDLRRSPRKVLVLDLDNTLWGGVIGDDGLEGIEIGDTSPRGEAFKAFQKYVASLKERGVLLAVCSKNDEARAREPFERHPEMVLKLADFVSFLANWEPKSDNLRRMAEDLGLGLDAFVFVDDSPAEVEIVRQLAPEVTAILLGPDPATYTAQLQDCRLFEPRRITAEDVVRTAQYRQEGERRAHLASATDLDAYLGSLDMEAVIRELTALDVPRLAQLINKSNQFNLTTRRRSEAEVLALLSRPDYIGFSIRLSDRFGDHGLVSVVIGRVAGDAMEIDTWLMSCRVLKRQVEETALNELARLARARGCARLEGLYLATTRNEMVRDFYPRMGFEARAVTPVRGEYTLGLHGFVPRQTRILIREWAHAPS